MKSKIDGFGKTPLEKAWYKSEQCYTMSQEDYMLGGPRKSLTLRQFAKANNYNIRTGQKNK